MAPTSSTTQLSLSGFFKPTPTTSIPKKRPDADSVDTIDLSLSSSDSESAPLPKPAFKKPKLEDTSSSGPIPPASTSLAPSQSLKPAHQRVAQFRFDPLLSPTKQIAPSQKEIKRREKYAAKLLSGQGPNLLKHKSIYLQSEHYLAAHPEASGSRPPVGSEDGGGDDEEEEEMQEEDDDEPAAKNGKGKGKAKQDDSPPTSRFGHFAAKGSKGKESAPKKYTPLEQQVIALKKAHKGVVLMVEVGYKYRFFEEDAQLASRILGIACFPSKSMLNASIPSHRLNVHIKRLINAGHKVGVVRQLETAALKKVSDNRSAPFTRGLSALYTSATFIDELATDTFGSSSANPTILCLVEEPTAKGQDHKVKLGLLAVVPATGEIVYDEFEDGHMRSELETRMLHLQPSELVLQKNMSKQTESMVAYLVGNDVGSTDSVCRTERIEKKFSVQAANTFVAEYFAKAKKASTSDEIVIDGEEDNELNRILDLPKSILVALASLLQHLTAFHLDTMFLHTASFSHFSNQAVMHLNGNTLANLEILRNQTDFSERGSLLSILDHCKTAFGRRLMRKWVSKPLVSLTAVNERLDAVTEINQKSSALVIVKLRELFRGLPDLERGLVRISLGKATPQELLKVLQALERVANVFEEANDGDEVPKGAVQSPVLRKIVTSLPKIKPQVDKFLSQIVPSEARAGNKDNLFKDPDQFESLQDAKFCLGAVEAELQEHLKTVRKIVKKPALEFIKVADQEFLIELRISDAKKLAPDNWIKINSTKACWRYRTPQMQTKIEELEQARETLAAEAQSCFLEFLQQVSECYDTFRAAISSVATADCLFSLAVTALSPGYCRPDIISTPGVLEIKAGRHPMTEVLLSDPFVPNDISLGGSSTKQMILTGLNMGGKSSLSRSTALIALMAQIGSYVPADSCRTSLFDGIYTRMGASDELARGRSTFMVELSETSEILKLATPRSLIILDELGRGTSTSDGQAIASAVLQYVVTTSKSLCIFVTHYPSLAEVSKQFPDSVSCHHMACLEKERKDGFADVVFLYKLAKGLASKSHGLNVARMAELPDSVLKKAFEKSKELELVFEAKVRAKRVERMSQVLQTLVKEDESITERDKEMVVELCGVILHQV